LVWGGVGGWGWWVGGCGGVWCGGGGVWCVLFVLGALRFGPFILDPDKDEEGCNLH
jgi:hypothetical protein